MFSGFQKCVGNHTFDMRSGNYMFFLFFFCFFFNIGNGEIKHLSHVWYVFGVWQMKSHTAPFTAEHFTMSHKWQNWTSLVECHNSIPGVYYAIIRSARKQIPFTWFLFNCSTWENKKNPSCSLFSLNLGRKKCFFPPIKRKEKIQTYLRIAFSSSL